MVAFVLLGMFASSILTLTIAIPSVGDVVLPDATPAHAVPHHPDGISDSALNKLSTIYDLIMKNYLGDVDREELIDGAIQGMLGVLNDPYSTYMDAEQARQFNESITSSFQGIGAEVTMKNGYITIVAPMKGSPAEKAGIRPNDVIVSVNGESLEGTNLTEAIMKIRGPKGSQAKLGILREGAIEPIEVIVVRDEIPVETVFSRMLDERIGLIEIRQFAANTGEHFKEHLADLQKQGMQALIIDVRNNPGGLLQVVVDIAELFVKQGEPIVQIEDRNGVKTVTVSENEREPLDIPVAMLINGGSASASEILAGVIREVAGGILVGETTFGKGTVQVTYEQELGDGSNIKLTTYKWLTPKGNWIHERGIDPDIPVQLPDYFKVSPFSKQSVLKPDTTGEEVRTLQTMLTALGYNPGRHDGYYSVETMEAVKQYQKDGGLAVTGEADKKTQEKLEQDVMAKLTDPMNDTQLQEAYQAIKKEWAKANRNQ